MKRTLTVLMIALCGAGAALGAANALQDRNDQYSRREGDIIGARLFKAIVGRDGSGSGAGDASVQIVLGQLDAQVTAMFNSPEFRQKSSGMSPAQLLDQIYEGLLDRRADDGGIRTYLREIEQRHYQSVVMRIIADTEFQSRILGRSNQPNRFDNPNRSDSFDRPGRPDRPDRPRFNSADLMRAAESCQAEVVEQVRTDAGRPVLLRFQGMDRSFAGWGSETIRGSAVDVLGQNRRLSYTCEMDRDRFRPSRVTYNFDDGRTDWDYPLPSVRTCQDAIRSQFDRQRGRRDVVFESAGVSEWDGGLERVYGRGRERGSNSAFSYQCDVDRGRVTAADFRPAR
jgi:hypothetical protein